MISFSNEYWIPLANFLSFPLCLYFIELNRFVSIDVDYVCVCVCVAGFVQFVRCL